MTVQDAPVLAESLESGVPAPAQHGMRTGQQYRDSLRDGRRVWLLGDGEIADLTTHPLTAGMVNSYAQWYDRHHDPLWTDRLWTAAPDGSPRPISYEIPESAEQLQSLGRAISDVAFETAGNMTHPPSYGAMIAMGIVDCCIRMGVPADRLAAAIAYRDEVAQKQLFITMGAQPVTGDRFAAPNDKNTVRVVESTTDGVFVSGMLGLHTSTPFVDEVFVIAGLGPGAPENRIMFATPVAASGVRVVARGAIARHSNEFISPLSSQFDELEAQLWLDRVFVPWDRVFAQGFQFPAGPEGREFNSILAWMLWHQQLGWLARADFTVGLALAVADSMNLTGIPGVVDQLTDLIVDVEGVRSAVYASEHDPWTTASGYTSPNYLRMAPGALSSLRNRGRLSEVVRNLMGAAGMLTPADTDFADPEIGPGLERAFGGGRYTALQRSALMQFASDHAASAHDAREAAFESHANGGIHTWKRFFQRWYPDYDSLAARVMRQVGDDMPATELDSLRDPAPR